MRTWLVISSFRNDEAVLRLIEQARNNASELFERILVVDSQGTGRMPSLLRELGWTNVEYRCYEENLGSGANLAERLRIAAGAGADFAYAVNHDGEIDPDVIQKLLAAAQDRRELGAVYPLGYFTDTGRYNLTGTRELPLPAKLVKGVPKQPTIPVYWSSSNGALYSLEPARRGILPWAAMWMGWEDLEYGWRLKDHGYEQFIVTAAVYRDNQEYDPSAVGKVARKPYWRSYYASRNLILAVIRCRNTPLYHLTVLFRIVRECALTMLVRDMKWKRLRLLLAGARDGYRGIEKMAPVVP
jgi:GT2 family glycosyltransferase